jgi:PAS domain S-box-containing protein
MRNILDSIADGIVTVDLEGRVTLWNQSMQRHYDVAPPEVLGRRLVDVFPALVPEGVAARVDEILAGRAESFRIERVRHQTLRRGTAVMDLEGIALRDARGERIGAVLVVTDVTQQDVAAHQLQQTEKLAAIGTLAAGVAHEINNPVGIITARVETMLWDADDMGLPPAVQEDLRVIEKHAQRVAKIARGLLSFARRAPWETSWVDLNRLLEEALLLVERQFAKEGILLERALEPGLPPVRGSVNHLEQVVINFLNNAREAMAGGGRLSVTSRRGPREGWVVVRIADSGPGIPAEHLSRIFDPFFTTKAAGTGLGLAVSYGIVQEHGGTIEVESAAGRGTTFIVALPVAGAAARPPARASVEAPPPPPTAEAGPEARPRAGAAAAAEAAGGGGPRQGGAPGGEGGIDGRT